MTKATWLKGEFGTYSVMDCIQLAVKDVNLAAIPTKSTITYDSSLCFFATRGSVT